MKNISFSEVVSGFEFITFENLFFQREGALSLLMFDEYAIVVIID
jgi:hypothetical protein